jgi:hypothetical protein
VPGSVPRLRAVLVAAALVATVAVLLGLVTTRDDVSPSSPSGRSDNATRPAVEGPTPTARSSEPTPSPGPGILLSRAELMALPTSGPAWEAIMARVQIPSGGSYRLGTRDDSNIDVLAYALAGARLDDESYKRFVRDKVEHMMTAPRKENDLLGPLRHLQTYVISADLIDLRSVDPALDARFREWLSTEIFFQYTGAGGGSVVSTHERRPNNFGTHAGASRIAAALYLGDAAELKAARDVWYGWATGDSAFVPDARVWTGTDWQCSDSRPAGINQEGCRRDGHSLDGVIPEDQERCGEYSWPPCATSYIHGATDGMTLSFWMLARQGEDPWAWGDRAALRQMRWKYEVGQPPHSGYRWQIPVVEAAYGLDLPGNDPAETSTNFGYADWWATPSGAQPTESERPGRDREPAPAPAPPSVDYTVPLVVLLVLVLATLVAVRIRKRARTRTGKPTGKPTGKR